MPDLIGSTDRFGNQFGRIGRNPALQIGTGQSQAQPLIPTFQNANLGPAVQGKLGNILGPGSARYAHLIDDHYGFRPGMLHIHSAAQPAHADDQQQSGHCQPVLQAFPQRGVLFCCC